MTDEIPKALSVALQTDEANAAAIERMKDILRGLGISMSVDGCGCCGSPHVTFSFNRKTIVDQDDCRFDTSGDSNA